jgi:uncharacterized protein YecE (DUF72 family)
VGCSGWSYRHWKGNFYPADLPGSRWLDYYSRHFDTVEINSTFYRLPSTNAVRSWSETTPAGFCFSVKVSRLITHFHRLVDCRPQLERFLERVRPLGEHLGPLLYQLPPDLERDLERLQRFLEWLPGDLIHVFEFRNASWWHDEVFDLLRIHGMSFCAYDMGETETPVVATGRDAYLRFHGPEGNPGRGYDEPELSRWLDRIRDAGGQRVWVYFNNDVGGHAPRDAKAFRSLADACNDK